jgi:enoyl-CoA hydratase
MALGANLSVEDAHRLGLVNALLDDAGFDAAVAEYARQFVPPAKAAKAVGAIKRAVVSGLEMDFHSGLALERELQQQLFVSDDAKEGIAAYVDKRAPVFKGR